MAANEVISVKQTIKGIKVSYSWFWPGNRIGFALFTVWTGSASLVFALMLMQSGMSAQAFAPLSLAVLGAGFVVYFLARLLNRTDLLVTARELQVTQRPFGWFARRSIPTGAVRFIFSEASIFRLLGEGQSWVSNQPPKIRHSLTVLLDGNRKVCLISNIESVESARQLVEQLNQAGIGRALPPIEAYDDTRPLQMLPVTGGAAGILRALRGPYPSAPCERILPVGDPLRQGRLVLTLLFAVLIGAAGLSIPIVGGGPLSVVVIAALAVVLLSQVTHLYQQSRIQQAYQRGNAVAMARIRERKEAHTGEQLLQRVRLEFTPTHSGWRGGAVTLWASVSAEVYAELETGQAVTVRYATGNPRILLMDDEVLGTRLGEVYKPASAQERRQHAAD